MSKLQVVATLGIHEGKLDDFKRTAAQCVSLVKEKDTGTLQYEWFLNSDQTECKVQEAYESSEALLAHMGNLGDALTNLLAVSDLSSLEVLGDPSPQLLEAVSQLNIKVYSFFTGV